MTLSVFRDRAKRSFLIFLSSLIIFCSVHYAYTESVEAADFVIGLTASLSAGPLLTALLVGGVVVAGVITIDKYMSLTPAERQQLQDDIVQGFQDFVAEQEKHIALEQDQSLTDQQAADIGVANAREVVNNFITNCLDRTRTTGKSLKLSTVRYWKQFCGTLKDIMDNDFTMDQVIPSPDNPVEVPHSTDLENTVSIVKTNTDNTFVFFDGNYFILKGSFRDVFYEGFEGSDVSETIRLPFVVKKFEPNSPFVYYEVQQLYIDRMYFNGTYTSVLGGAYQASGDTSSIDNYTTLPLLTFSSTFGWGELDNLRGKGYVDILSVGKTWGDVQQWMRDLQSRIMDNKLGEEIASGRRRLIAEGDYVGTVFEDTGSIPIKKKGLREEEGVAVGSVGWDLPADDTWDDVLQGVLPFPQAPSETGTIEVPYPQVVPGEAEGEVEFPIDEPVEDSDPKEEGEEGDPDEPTTPEDVINQQGGLFYPETMDLTEIFPFCIPFDIIYLFDTYLNGSATAPVFEIPIVYPEAIQDDMGSESYIVTIDMADYVVLRDVMRVFLLLLFILGLMKITRSLIRG